MFDYQTRRTGRHAASFLAGWQGHLPIDNNPVENVIRPIALGKKNWLFTGSERAGQRAAVILKLFKIAVRVVQYKDRVKLHLATHCPAKHLLLRVCGILFMTAEPVLNTS